MATIREWDSAQWILYDPQSKALKNRFRKKDGSATDDVTDAKLYPSEEEAKKEAGNEYVPRSLSDFLPPKP
jgi:hypothetical protein